MYILYKYDDEWEMVFNTGVTEKREELGLLQNGDPISHQRC